MSSQKTRTDSKDSGAKRHSASGKKPIPVNAGTQAEALRLEQAIEDPSAATPADLLALQGRHGNEAVSSLIQTKLRVGPAGDSYEQEADRVADRALDRPVRGAVQRQVDPEEEEIQAKPLAASITPLVQRQELEDEEEELQAAPTAQRTEEGFEAGASIEQRLASLRGSGSPLPDELRADMEARFGTGFGGVRVHTDAESDALNRDLRAKAFTLKKDIYFSSGQYDTESKRGKHLLAHELTHVVQQTGGGTGPSSTKGSVARGQQVAHSTGGEPAVQRNGPGGSPVSDEEEERKRKLQEQASQGQSSQPLMLTDKPWSEMEKERSPVPDLLGRGRAPGSNQMPVPGLRSPLQIPGLRLPVRIPGLSLPTQKPQAPSKAEKPLMLTDKPWSEMEEAKEGSEKQPVQAPAKDPAKGPAPVGVSQALQQVGAKGAAPVGVSQAVQQIGAKAQAQQGGGPPQISEPKAKPGQKMTGMGPDLWAENLMREHNIDPKDWAMLGKEQQAKLTSDITSGNPKRAKRTLGKAQAEREGKAPGAFQTWKAGWGAFFKETIPSKLSALTPTSTSRAQQRAVANRRKALGGQAPGPQPAKSNIGTIEQFLKERKAAKEEKAKSEKGGDTASKGGVSGLDAGIKIGELQAEVKALRAKVEELDSKGG